MACFVPVALIFITGVKLAEEIPEIVDGTIAGAQWWVGDIHLPVPDHFVLIQLLADVFDDGFSDTAVVTISVTFQLGEGESQMGLVG